MSKKLIHLEKAVLYAQQKPMELAKVLADLVKDVATTLTLNGPTTVTGGADTVTADYKAEVLSQYGDAMSTPTITYALDSVVEGVSIGSSDGKVSITSAVADKTKFTVKATAGSLTKKLEVTVVKPSE